LRPTTQALIDTDGFGVMGAARNRAG